MRQIGAEKDDPLKRIQEEINEVARRERELREKIALANGDTSSNNTQNDSVSAQSDDSGVSSASSPINGVSTNGVKESKYIRSNTVNPTSTKLYATSNLTRTMSTPQIFMPTRFNISTGQKGLMQRFIASRGKFALGNNMPKDTLMTTIDLSRPPTFTQSTEITPPIIERDELGRPLRRGFVPVEEKIQKELRDLKTRESELKRLRRQNTSKINQSEDIDDSVEYDSGEDSDNDEHCYSPGKLRASKSIGELCDSLNNNTSFSPSDSPSPQFNRHGGSGGMRPAVSLAQLCNVEPEEAPSSHRLIAQWENIIQQQQEVA
jgi:hypothetical protein